MRRMALVAYFVSVVISSACASSDEFGWWRVKDVPVPDVEFQDDSPPLRALPVPDGTVNMDLGLALGLPATTFGESPMVADPEIVNAVWDLGAAVTAYRNLGGKPGTPIGKLETGKITPDRFKRIPNNLPEELTLDEATHGAGTRIMENKVLGDPRYSGMEKWQHVHVNPDGTKIVIHFVVDPRTGVRTDFKFK